MVCSEADSFISAECTRQSLRRQLYMRRSASLPGKCNRHCVRELIHGRQHFTKMQKEGESVERQALEQRYDAFDALVKLDLHTLQLRRGKPFDLSSSCPEKVDSTVTAPRQSRLSHYGTLSDNSPECHPRSAPRSNSLPKLPQIADSKSLGSSGKLKRRNSISGKTSGSKHRSSKDYETSQTDAFRALVASMDAGKPLADLMCSLSRHVLTHLGAKAFTAEQHKLAMDAALQAKGFEQEPTLEEAPKERIELVVQCLRDVSKEIGMAFSDVVGQVLWRNRRSDALQKKRHKDVAEDLAWVMPSGTDCRAEQYKVVDEVFEMLCGENGRMNCKGWSQIVRLVGNSPVLADRISLSDWDRLWFTQTRMNSSRELGHLHISLNGFKALLLSLGEAMKVHPWMIFLAVGSYSGSGTSTPCSSSTPSRSNTAFTSSHKLW